jgi:hypothetical protein
MALQQPIKDLLSFLRRNPGIRMRIAAPPDSTLLYAGAFFRPVWQELERLRASHPELAAKRLLPDVLAQIPTPGQPAPTLLAWAKSLDSLVPWSANGFIAWRALSGIYASNAVGAVSFYVGSGITKAGKVFAATEVPVLLRNSNVDAVTKDILGYYQRCIQSGQSAVNFGFVAG